eukprot:scaffold3.g6482.t1
MERRGSPVPVPNLPGYSVREPAPIDAVFKKAQTLVFKNGYAVPATLGDAGWSDAPPAGGAFTIPAYQPASPSAAPAPAAAATGRLPKWVEHDKQCLRFMAYFVEAVPNSPAEDWRARRVAIVYYLEDDTMQVDEPREPNSGILQARSGGEREGAGGRTGPGEAHAEEGTRGPAAVGRRLVEVVELLEPNAGRDPFTFLKRGPLPKAVAGPVLGSRADPAALYQPADLRIGGFVTVHGRQFYLFDMDVGTRKWYQASREHMGSSPEELAPVDVSVPRAPLPVPALPPWNGYGTLEDSLQNCVKLCPSPPKRDLYKLMNKEKIVLRFSCRLLEGEGYRLVSADAGRRFVLSFFAADDTVAVFEPPQRNSGIVGGKFLERARVQKPGPGMRWYEEGDFFVGAVIALHGRRFLLESADDFTLERLRAFGPSPTQA